MPAYSIAGRYKKREPDYVPPPSTYEQNHGTISDDVISFKTAGERNKYLKEQRELWKEEHKKKMEELREKAEEKEDDDIPRPGETLTYPMTESRTRTENFAAKNAQEPKIQEQPRSIKRYKKLVPPGPGSYEVPSGFNSKKTYLTEDKKKRLLEAKKRTNFYVTPGPGHFEIASTLGGPSLSMGGGPFSVSLEKELQGRRQLSVKQFSQPELRALPTTIGTSSGVKINPPDCKSVTDYKSLNRTCAGGPGSYDPKILNTSPAFTMVGRGEAALHTKSNDDFSKPKSLIPKSTLPGPADHFNENTMNYLHPPLSKTISPFVPRSFMEIASNTPGPGAFNPRLPQTKSGPKIMQRVGFPLATISKEYKLRSERSTIDKPPQKVQAFFGGGKRTDFVPKIVTPGPGEYEVVPPLPNMEPQEENEEEYTVRDTCTFGMKTMKFFVPNNNPGPGSHFLSSDSMSTGSLGKPISYSGLAYSIGKGQRSNQLNPLYTDMYYDSPSVYPGSSISIGNDPKPGSLKKSKYPGPGTYNVPGTVGIIPPYLLMKKTEV